MQNYQQIPKNVKCPVCYTDNARILWCVSSKQAAQHFVLQEKYPERFLELVSHIESLWGKNTCEVVQCDNCEFCYSNPYVAGDEKFYSLAYDSYGYPKWKWEFQVTYDVLNKRTFSSDVQLLEIGAGDGAFVKRVAESISSKENIFCTEFSEYGRHHIEKFGIRCLSEDVRNLSNIELEGKLDVVCMFQVLEHMDRLNVLFQKLNWMMKKGGSLFIAVPNQSRIEFNEINGALLDMPPNHIGRWNKKCFEEIAKRNGFQVEEYKIEKSNFFSMIKQFIIYRFLRRSHQSGSFENQICKIRNRYLLRIMQIIGIVVNSITAIPKLTKINSGLGNSQWVHLTKLY
jgi:2-polyprenyl-3-methyl-5-hydroxy-6-metoxy-1,4-benzoquinol methylase